MSRAGAIGSALRSATVVAAGAIGVHQLRYLVGYGADAPRALEAHGHAYLDALLPILALLAGVTVLATVLAGIAGSRPSRRRAPVARALLYAGAILAVFGVQEIVEGATVAAHPAGIAAIVTHGGLIALPLAVAVGWVVWAALRGLEALEEGLQPPDGGHARGPRATRPRALAPIAPHPAVLTAGAAPRAPPSA